MSIDDQLAPADGVERSLEETLGVKLQPGQELIEETPGVWVIRMEAVVAPPETWAQPVVEQVAVRSEHPPLVQLDEHARIRILEVRDMGSNSAHIDAEIEGVDGTITAGCGVDQIMDRDPTEREAWCRQVVWDHYVTNVAPPPPKHRVLDLSS